MWIDHLPTLFTDKDLFFATKNSSSFCQCSLYIDWKRNYKTITDFVKRNPVLETIDGETLEMEDPTDLEEPDVHGRSER